MYNFQLADATESIDIQKKNLVFYLTKPFNCKLSHLLGAEILCRLWGVVLLCCPCPGQYLITPVLHCNYYIVLGADILFRPGLDFRWFCMVYFIYHISLYYICLFVHLIVMLQQCPTRLWLKKKNVGWGVGFEAWKSSEFRFSSNFITCRVSTICLKNIELSYWVHLCFKTPKKLPARPLKKRSVRGRDRWTRKEPWSRSAGVAKTCRSKPYSHPTPLLSVLEIDPFSHVSPGPIPNELATGSTAFFNSCSQRSRTGVV